MKITALCIAMGVMVFAGCSAMPILSKGDGKALVTQPPIQLESQFWLNKIPTLEKISSQ
ncbi:hypothetical protein [Vibrio ostreicida]|uniref:hypothetical protein n=1 Tax=Vibrio ostreicida TaxID=526588 RepID=UPI0015C3BE9C|nr:hypothetical protein [Vibrio ostreicida]